MPRLVLLAAALWLAGCSSEPRSESAGPAGSKPAPVKILQFYASPAAVGRGDTVSLCYGVENAASVRLEPDVASIFPSPNRCVQFAPRETASYTLIAGGRAGQGEARQSLEIRVGPRASAKPPAAAGGEAALIETFTASAEQVAPGRPVTICYIVRGADSVKLDPPPAPVELSERACISVRPTRTQTYTLTATGKGRTERRQLVVRVK
ncbi:MAG: hypothetical protein ACM336_14765 [Acidobacteriota bacterium]